MVGYTVAKGLMMVFRIYMCIMKRSNSQITIFINKIHDITYNLKIIIIIIKSKIIIIKCFI